MVRAVENWAEVTGQVEGLREDPDRRGFLVVALRVTGVEPVPGVPDLFARDVGTLVELRVAAEVAERAGLRPGTTVRCRARKAGPGLAFAHPDRFGVSPR